VSSFSQGSKKANKSVTGGEVGTKTIPGLMVTAVVFQAFAVSNSVLLLAGVVVFFSSSFLQDDTVKNANAAIISAIFFIVFCFGLSNLKILFRFITMVPIKI
jgi:hypothetical protein